MTRRELKRESKNKSECELIQSFGQEERKWKQYGGRRWQRKEWMNKITSEWTHLDKGSCTRCYIQRCGQWLGPAEEGTHWKKKWWLIFVIICTYIHVCTIYVIFWLDLLMTMIRMGAVDWGWPGDFSLVRFWLVVSAQRAEDREKYSKPMMM